MSDPALDHKCIINPDKNCLIWRLGQCMSCSQGSYLNFDNQCRKIGPHCADFNHETLNCESCYPGYTIEEGDCVIELTVDYNCKDRQNEGCKECYYGFWVKEGRCVLANALCRTYSMTTGECLSCYRGYYRSNGQCLRLH